MANFDFDHWCGLAERDPEAFFRARHGAIERFIQARPALEAQRLREVQSRIDCARMAAGTPLNAMREMSRLMQERLQLLCEQEVALTEATRRLSTALSRLEHGERVS